MLGLPHERTPLPPPHPAPNRAALGFEAGCLYISLSSFLRSQTLSFWNLTEWVSVFVHHEQNNHDLSRSFMTVPNSHERVYI